MGRTTLIALVLPLLIRAYSTKKTNGADPVFQQIDNIVKTLADITGLEEQHPVPYGRMSQTQLKKFLEHRIKKTVKPKEIEADELTLKLFGLVPQDYDLRKSTVDLLTEQAAAFYDYREKRLFLLDVASFTSEETTLAHELSHALADQHFNLAKFVDNDSEDDDENLAHTAIVEGQASWLMLAYARKRSGLDGPPPPEQIATVVQAGDGSSPEYPVLQGSPLYIRESLLFPYTEGTKFFDEVYRKLGQAAFREVFSHPPATTAQVYHLDKYFDHVKSKKPKLPKLSFEGGETERISGSLGEFDQRMLLWQFCGKEKAISLSPHALGGEYKVIQTGKKAKRDVLEYVSEWDSAESASDYLAAYKEALQKKWKRCQITTASGDLYAGSSETGYFITKREGSLVTIVEGIAEETDWKRILDASTNQSEKNAAPAATNGDS